MAQQKKETEEQKYTEVNGTFNAVGKTKEDVFQVAEKVRHIKGIQNISLSKPKTRIIRIPVNPARSSGRSTRFTRR